MSQSPPLSGSIFDFFRLSTGAAKNADKLKGNTSSSPKSQSSNNTRVNNKIISSPAAATIEKKSATSPSILRNLSEKLKKKNGAAKFTQKHYEQYIKDYIKKTDKDVIDLNKIIIKSVDAKIPHEAVVTSPDDCENALKIIKYHLLHYNLINEKPIRMIGKPTVGNSFPIFNYLYRCLNSSSPKESIDNLTFKIVNMKTKDKTKDKKTDEQKKGGGVFSSGMPAAHVYGEEHMLVYINPSPNNTMIQYPDGNAISKTFDKVKIDLCSDKDGIIISKESKNKLHHLLSLIKRPALYSSIPNEPKQKGGQLKYTPRDGRNISDDHVDILKELLKEAYNEYVNAT